MSGNGEAGDALRTQYQEIILDHYRKPRNRGELADATATVHKNNPVCGDRVTVQLDLDGDRIETIRFSGAGCSISQASASIMTELVGGTDRAGARDLAGLFRDMLHGDARAASQRALGDARALAGVARFPARVRCALLAWEALESAMQDPPADEQVHHGDRAD